MPSIFSRRTADPLASARSSGLVGAWRRKLAEQATGNPLANEHWYAYLLTIARPVPPPVCSYCEDSGAVTLTCTITARCAGHLCQTDRRRSDPDWTHTYVRACACAAGQGYQTAWAQANQPEAHRPRAAKAPASVWRKATG